jgi:hypothetical protein
MERMEAIGRSLEQSGHARALIGLGSVGVEQDRLDDYSDLDFFVIAEVGFKHLYIENLDWLQSVHPVAYHFRDTTDGHKLLFADGVLCDFAIFEPTELSHIPFTRGRIVWKQLAVDEAICIPSNPGTPPQLHTVEWLVGEVLTNLYVGLCRFHRGEKLSGQRLVQHHAVDRLLELAALVEQETPGSGDAFENERRFERRFPTFGEVLPRFI